MICFGSSSLKRSHVSARRCFESSDASRASWRRDSMSRYISRTLSDHWTIASWSSFWILPSVRRQRLSVSSRMSSALAFGSAVSSTSRRSPLPRSRAFSTCFSSMPSTRALSSSWIWAFLTRSPSITRLMCLVTAPFFEPVALAISL